MTESEFAQWYWLREELASFARELGLSASGGKRDIESRIAAKLGGRAPSAPVRRTNGRQLDGELSRQTVLPPGQRSSQLLRKFFENEIGPAFHFDAAMRTYISDGAGRTLGEAIEHWRATRTTSPTSIDEQFEYNRFTRQWYAEHPGSDRSQLLAAWWQYRGSPRS